MRNNSTNHSRGIIDSTWGRVPGLHAHSEAEAILEQRLLFVSLCEARTAFTRLWGIIVRIIPEASLTAPEDECLACMLTRKRRPYLSNDCSLFHCVRQGHWLHLHKTMRNNSTNHSRGIIDSTWGRVPGLHAHLEGKEAILEQLRDWVIDSKDECLALCFIVWGKDRPHKTMRNNSTNHSRGIIDSTWGRVPGLHAHSEAEAILEQRLLFVSLWGKDGLHKTMRNISTNHSRGIIDSTWGRVPGLGSGGHTWATIALCFIVWGKDGLHKTMRNNSTNHSRGIIDSTWGRVPGLHAHSEAEAILEQRLLFVSLCEAKPAFTRLWGIIVRIIPEASLTAPEDECLACMLTRKRRPYLSNNCSLFHCVRQGRPSQDYEE